MAMTAEISVGCCVNRKMAQQAEQTIRPTADRPSRLQDHVLQFLQSGHANASSGWLGGDNDFFASGWIAAHAFLGGWALRGFDFQ